LVYRNSGENYYIRSMRPWGTGSYGVFMEFRLDYFSTCDFRARFLGWFSAAFVEIPLLFKRWVYEPGCMIIVMPKAEAQDHDLPAAPDPRQLFAADSRRTAVADRAMMNLHIS
jgi:hypothetical protein